MVHSKKQARPFNTTCSIGWKQLPTLLAPSKDVSCIEHSKYEIAARMSLRHSKGKCDKKGDA